MCALACLEVRGQLAGFSSLLPSRGFRESNPDDLSWLYASSLTKSAQPFQLSFFLSFKCLYNALNRNVTERRSLVEFESSKLLVVAGEASLWLASNI